MLFLHVIYHLFYFTIFTADADAVFISGDLNGQIGKLLDCMYVVDIYDIGKRVNIGQVKNVHGDAIIEFVKDSCYSEW